MTKVHRALLSTLDNVRSVTLDSSYGFQGNVQQMTDKVVSYFDTSLQIPIAPLHLPNYERASVIERAVFKEQVRSSTYVFAGPGSPSYALRQWAPLDLVEDLSAVLESGGVVCFSSAAALTLGAATAPIYEMYKVGDEPFWLDGLNLLSRFGLDAAIIPHFDNAEGGTYDTSCCYIGAQRLAEMATLLPPAVGILGIDEHTGAIIDAERRTLEVQGKGGVTWIQNGQHVVYPAGSVVPLVEFGASDTEPQAISMPSVEGKTPLHVLAEEARLPGPEGDRALAQLVVLATHGNASFVNPELFVPQLLKLRDEARASKDFALADQLRDILTSANIELNDSASGTTFVVKTP
jgi:hypothetical protein